MKPKFGQLHDAMLGTMLICKIMMSALCAPSLVNYMDNHPARVPPVIPSTSLVKPRATKIRRVLESETNEGMPQCFEFRDSAE